MESIIKKAMEGGYIEILPEELAGCVLDPLFWQSLGKACGWKKTDEQLFWLGNIKDKVNDYSVCGIGELWKYYALRFHEINLTEGWDEAVKWLEDLIK